MSGRLPIWTAFLANCVVAGLTCAARGWSAAGAHAAARNTARFSALWFIVAFAAPGLVRIVRSLPNEVRLIQAFVVAHIVHFAAVVAVLTKFEPEHVARNVTQTVLVVLVGFSIVMVAGLTARPRASRLYTTVHKVTLYAILLIFALAFLHNPLKPLRLMGVALILALVARLTSRMAFWTATVEKTSVSL
ncbi:MAG TPA: hypothetical protein VEV41_21270 [Terriglobales bacterium]|nr:hypothetical protein [Terriglobales bacterium]